MKKVAQLTSAIGLAATTLPCVMFFFGMINHDLTRKITLIGTGIWFVATPIWMGRTQKPQEASDFN